MKVADLDDSDRDREPRRIGSHVEERALLARLVAGRSDARDQDELLAASRSGVIHEAAIGGMDLFMSLVHLHGSPAPVRRFLPHHLDLIANGDFHRGKVFDLTLPLEVAAEGHRAMDERRAIETLLTT